MAAVRQRAPYQFDVHMSFVLVVATGDVGLAGAAVDNVQAQRRVRRCDLLELLLECMFTGVAQAVVEMNRSRRLLGDAPAQHAHHRRDADAAGNQHRRHVRIGVDEEVAGRGLHAQDVADPHMIMEVAGRQAGCDLRMIGRRGHALDGHTVVRRFGAIRQEVAPRDRARDRGHVRGVRSDIQGEGQELAWLECRQRRAIDRL